MQGGAGKTTYCWQQCNRLVASYRFGAHRARFAATIVDGVTVGPPLPWTPICLPLRRVTMAQLPGLLQRHLTSVVGVSPGHVEAIRRQEAGSVRVRLLLLCDGLDEAKGDIRALRNIVSAICGTWVE